MKISGVELVLFEMPAVLLLLSFHLAGSHFVKLFEWFLFPIDHFMIYSSVVPGIIIRLTADVWCFPLSKDVYSGHLLVIG